MMQECVTVEEEQCEQVPGVEITLVEEQNCRLETAEQCQVVQETPEPVCKDVEAQGRRGPRGIRAGWKRGLRGRQNINCNCNA